MILKSKLFSCFSVGPHNLFTGVEIVCTGLTWSPYNIHDDCNDVGRNCTNSGLLADMMSMWAKEYNFTWDVYADINGDWGLKPVSGT